MKLPELKKATFSIVVDDAEMILSEPTLEQLTVLSSISQYSGKNKDIDINEMVKEIKSVIVTLMGTYEATEKEKVDFVGKLSIRQIKNIADGLVESLTESVKKKDVISE